MRITRFLYLGALFMCTGCVAYGPVTDRYGYGPGYGVATYNPAGPVYVAPSPVYFPPVYAPPVYVRPAARVVVPIYVAPPVVRMPNTRPYRNHHHRHGRPG
jgi:hypothetical protein